MPFFASIGVVWHLFFVLQRKREMSSGIHSANNLTSFIFAGLGLSQVTTTITMSAFMTDTLSVLIACTLTYYLSKKLGWFKEENL
jgi:ABC-type spermidine/putrescine transport system permease subunit I